MKISASVGHNHEWGLRFSPTSPLLLVVQSYEDGNSRHFYSGNGINYSTIAENPCFTEEAWHRIKIINDGLIVKAYVNEDEIGSGISTYIPTSNVGLHFKEHVGQSEHLWAFVRKYSTTEPTVIDYEDQEQW